MINIAICDDEKMQVELLNKYVNNWARERNQRVHVEFFYNAESFNFAWSMDKKYNVLLLDIEMPGEDGVQLAKKIRKVDSQIDIIFITAISDYIGEGYNVDAINYLIKPIREEKLDECLDKVIEKITKEEKSMLIEVDGETIRILEKDVLYIEASSHSIDVYTVNGKYRVRKNISIMEEELDGESFIRCHRSYIVGLRHIKRIGKTDIILDNNHMVPVSRRQYSPTNLAFIKYHGGE